MLSGHTDVVPVAGQQWTAIRSALTERDGQLYGRGTADMKGFHRARPGAGARRCCGSRLDVPLHIAFTHDEETGCFGAPALIARIAAGRRAAAAWRSSASRPRCRSPTRRRAAVSSGPACWASEGHSSAPEPRRQRDLRGRRDHRRDRPPRGRGSGARAARQRLRPAAHDARRSARSPAAPRSTSSRATAPSTGICATCPMTMPRR